MPPLKKDQKYNDTAVKTYVIVKLFLLLIPKENKCLPTVDDTEKE